MSKTQQGVWAVSIVLVVIGGVFWWVHSSSSGMSAMQMSATTTSTTNMNTSNSGQSGSGVSVGAGVSTGTSAPVSATVTFNGNSFSPANVTIAQGGTVTFNSTGGAMWVASDPHPLHNGYDGTTQQQHCAGNYNGPAPFDQCSPGTSFSFTFNKIGTWGYHDHLNDDIGGSITVVAQ